MWGVLSLVLGGVGWVAIFGFVSVVFCCWFADFLVLVILVLRVGAGLLWACGVVVCVD